MNKEVIKKYLDEFTRWINGGEVLCRADGNWVNVWRSAWDCSVYTFVINDEYVEFRKALAEGKTIQSNKYDGTFMDCDVITFSGNPNQYRIKPDEPEFKVGDYVVRLKDSTWITLLQESNLNTYNGKEGYLDLGREVRLWTLEEADDDEWVVVEIEMDRRIIMTASEAVSLCVDNAIPYIGQSPAELGLEK